jgi:1,4-dihydroxy-6-naphthoate synthase
VVRRNLGAELCDQLCDTLRSSLLYALEHREEAGEWACQHGRGMDGGCGEEHISLFANQDSVHMPEDVRMGLCDMFHLLEEVGISTTIPELDIVEGKRTSFPGRARC